MNTIDFILASLFVSGVLYGISAVASAIRDLAAAVRGLPGWQEKRK